MKVGNFGTRTATRRVSMVRWTSAAVSIAALFAFGGFSPAQAFPTDPPVVDGQVSADWGIVIKNGVFGGFFGTGANTPPLNSVASGSTVPVAPTYYGSAIAANAFGLLPPASLPSSPNIPSPGNGNPFLEDTADDSNNYTVGPVQGGQDYDAEFMYVALKTGAAGTIADSRIYVAIVSGIRPDSGATLFGVGDMKIKPSTNNGGGDEFWIEMGGGPATAAVANSQTEGVVGTTFQLSGDGHTSSSAQNITTTVGEMRKNPTIQANPVAGSVFPEYNNTQMVDGTGTAVATNPDFFATWNDLCADGTFATVSLGGACAFNGGLSVHSIIELSFDADFLAAYVTGSGALAFSIAWGPACGNDVAEISFIAEPSLLEIPEPGMVAMFGASLLGLGLPAWRRRRKAAK